MSEKKDKKKHREKECEMEAKIFQTKCDDDEISFRLTFRNNLQTKEQ